VQTYTEPWIDRDIYVEDNYPKIINPLKIDSHKVTGKTLPFVTKYDNKPCLSCQSDGSMVLLTNHRHVEYAQHGQEWTFHWVLFHSPDGGRTWTNGKHAPFFGEPNFFTSPKNTIICISADMDPGLQGVGTTYGGEEYDGKYILLNRSTDGGHTWTRSKLTIDMLADGEYFDTSVYPCMLGAYDMLAMPDGSIMFGVCYGNCDFMLRSYDDGVTWKAMRMNYDQSPELSYYFEHGPYHRGILEENVFFHTPSGRLMRFARLEGRVFEQLNLPNFISPGEQTGIDQDECLIMMESPDDGVSWQYRGQFGVPGVMYPSVVHLGGNRMLVTFTMRMVPKPSYSYPYPHMGVHAIIVEERDDGTLDIDFDHDLIVIDDRTPDVGTSGGGFGKTIKLPDGDFITPYSYRYMPTELQDILRDEKYMDREVYEAARLASPFDDSRFIFKETTSKALNRHHFADYFAHETHGACELTGILRWRLD
jgi:hypothetical protein